MAYDVLRLPPRIVLGKEGENKYTTISIDVANWALDGATYGIVYERSDGTCYPVDVESGDDVITWTPTATDLIAGYGKLEVRMYKDDVIAKSVVTATYVSDSLNAGDEPSEEVPDWVQKIIDAYVQISPATTEKLGLVKVDGSTVTVDTDGTLHAKADGNYEDLTNLPSINGTTLKGNVDLPTSADVEKAITDKGYTTMAEVEAKGYVTDTDVESKGYQTASDVEKAITSKGYDTVADVDSKLTLKVSASEIQSELGTSENPISDNCVTSALIDIGVVNAETAKTDVDYSSGTVSGAFMRFNGTISTGQGSSYKYSFINVVEGEHYEVTNNLYGFLAFCLIKDASGNVLYNYPEKVAPYSITYETKEIEIPTNGAVMYFSWATFGTAVPSIKKIGSTTYSPVNIEDYAKLGNNLYGKKWCACGDSFTAGDFSNYVDSEGKSGKESDAYDKEQGCYKTYPWWITNRNKMTLQWNAQAGNVFTNIEGATRPFSNTSSTVNYTKVDEDADYITIAFGLNESALTADQIGTKTDTTNATLWGAYNIVFEYLITKCPYAKIGVIVSDAWLSQTYHDALIEICKYWGVPYLDLRDGENVPMLIGGRLSAYSSTAKTLRDNAFRVSSSDSHPNLKAHEYRSTIIENFLRSL